MINRNEVLESLREHLRILESKKDESNLLLGGSAFGDEIDYTEEEIQFWEQLGE